MKFVTSAILLFCINYYGQGQDFNTISSKILKEGLELYRNEMASWISTDSLSTFEKTIVKGYFTYQEKETGNLVSVYVDSTGENAIKRFSFEQISSTEIRLDTVEVNIPLTDKEKLILSVRNDAIPMIKALYYALGYSEFVNPNIIIHKTEPEFILYVIPGPFDAHIVPIGGDYYIAYKSNGKFKDFEPIHNNLIPFSFSKPGEINNSYHEHRGKRLGKTYITSTDICTLLLYQRAFRGEKHVVVHKKYISEFYFGENKIVIRNNTEKMKIR